MPLEQLGGGPKNGVAFLVGALTVYEILAANCSSPQTAEINANVRATTTMKWVYIGMAQAAFFVAAASVYDRAHAGPIIAGGVAGAGAMYLAYWHAQQSGMASDEPGTEDWSAPLAQAA
jgi:hypothetical protein